MNRDKIADAFGRGWRWVCKQWNGGPPDDDFGHISKLLEERNKALDKAIGQLATSFANSGSQMGPDLIFRLAAVDLFVEKAQAVLTARARKASRAGMLASAAAVSALALLGIYIVRHAADFPVDAPLATNALILRIVSAISLGAVVLVAVKYLISLARSFFHESVSLLSRRHALRFGRMYLYLDASQKSGDVDLKELRKAFDWNRSGESSFLDIKPEDIGKTPCSILAKGIGDAAGKAVEKGIDRAFQARTADKDAAQVGDETQSRNASVS